MCVWWGQGVGVAGLQRGGWGRSRAGCDQQPPIVASTRERPYTTSCPSYPSCTNRPLTPPHLHPRPPPTYALARFLHLQHLLDKPQALFALVLSPTRELAIQIAEQFEALGAGIGVKCAVLVGGIDMMAQVCVLCTGVCDVGGGKGAGP